MREVPLSLCERSSILSGIKDGIRHDGREFLEVRPLQIYFGKDYGCVTAILGETKVFAQVTSEVVEPRPSRANEGKISISTHMSPMAAAHFEQGRSNDLSDEISLLLDRNIKESRCLDLESLCILAEESVWHLKVDLTILNHAGNLGDACNLAAISALRHFHRPDVTVEEDGRVTIHTQEERELIPTFMKKVPVCLTFGFFLIDGECHCIMDPTAMEERVMSGKLVVGLNPHGEITSLVFPGKVKLEKRQIFSCINRAFEKAKSTAETVMKIVEEDLENRKSVVNPVGYLEIIKNYTPYAIERLKSRIGPLNQMDSSSVTIDAYQDKRAQAISMESDDKSDEEFPSELLSLTLPEIKARKKISSKKNKKLKIKADEEEDIKHKLTSDDIL